MKNEKNTQNKETIREITHTIHGTTITNVYRGLSTEERIKIYLRLCEYVQHEEAQK